MMSEKKVVNRNVAIALGIICIILAVGLVGNIANMLKDNIIASKDSTINDLNSQITSKNSQIAEKDNTISLLNSQVSSKDSQIASLTNQIIDLQNQTTSLQNEITSKQNEISSLNTQIADLQESLENLQARIVELERIVFTQVTIDKLEWNVTGNKVTVTIRNTGNLTATIQSIGLRTNVAGDPFATENIVPQITIEAGKIDEIVWAHNLGWTIHDGTSYVVRVTLSTGSNYEIIASTPEPQIQVRIDYVQWIVSQNTTKITVRNTGSLTATIESVAIRNNPGGTWYTTTIPAEASVSPTLPTTIDVWSTIDITVIWKSLKLQSNKSYVIRVTTTTGFNFELAFQSP